MKTTVKIALLMVFWLTLLQFCGQPVNAFTSTQGGNQNGVEVRELFYVHQDKYEPPDVANDLHFKLWQKEDNIDVNGWKVDISDFTTSGSQRGDQPEPAHSELMNLGSYPSTTDPDNGQHAVDVTASGTPIPYCNEVTVDATFWLTHYNTLRIHDASWTYALTSRKAFPDLGWTVDDPEWTGFDYIHEINIYNDDPTESFVVTGFSWLDSMNYLNLPGISFPDLGIGDFTISPGNGWTYLAHAHTETLHIYLKFAIKWNGDDVFGAIIDHRTSARAPTKGGGIWVSPDKLRLLAPYLGLVATIVATTVSTAIYVKRVRRRKEKR